MEFVFTSEEEAFRQEVREFLATELRPEDVAASTFLFFGDDRLWDAYLKMTKKLAAKGWLALGWPEKYGGSSGSYFRKVILFEEIAYKGAPGIDPFGVKMLAPILLAKGTEEQKMKHLPAIAKGETTWCQCFSEPDAGSDLASLKTVAKEDGDYFLLDGQKVWTTGAHRADWAIVLARTNQELSRHRGISFFMVDMKTPGIDVRPLTNILGERCFNEVYFDAVKIPKENMIGQKDRGWYVAMSLEGYERSGIEHAAECRRYLDRLIAFVNDPQNENIIDKQDAIDRLSKLVVRVDVCRWLAYRVAWLQKTGSEVSYEASMSKVFGSELMQDIGQVAMELLGLYAPLTPESKWAPLYGDIEKWFVGNLGRTIGGGTSEIQRNVIATRGLGLPNA